MTADFLAALGMERITAQTFPEAEGLNLAPLIMHGPHNALERRLRILNDKGSGVFVMINRGDMRGRKAENVHAVAAYFADLDGAPLLDAYPLKPTAVVESSPNRYHLYWRVQGAPLDDFGHVQKHVATLLNSDPKVCDLPRVMRLPGYWHKKAEPFQSRVLALEPSLIYQDAEFRETFCVPEPFRPPPLPKAVQNYLGNNHGNNRHVLLDRIATAGSGARNDTLFRNAAALANDVKAGTLDEETMRAEVAAAASLTGLDEREIERTITSALRYASAN